MQQKRYKVTRGAYTGTTDDRIDRWYIDDTESDVVDRRGNGFRTKREALEHIRELERLALAYPMR